MIPDTTSISSLEKAAIALKAGNRQSAIALLKQELASNPKNIDAILLLAQAVDDFKIKEKCYQWVQRLDAENLEAQIGLSAFALSVEDNPRPSPGADLKEALPPTLIQDAKEALAPTLIPDPIEPLILLSAPAAIGMPKTVLPLQPFIDICPVCASPKKTGARYCNVCGKDFFIYEARTNTSPSLEQRPTPANARAFITPTHPSAAIDPAHMSKQGASKAIWGWLLLIGGFASGYLINVVVGSIIQIAALVMAIILIRSPRDKTQGKIILWIWVVIQIIGFMIGLIGGLSRGRY